MTSLAHKAILSGADNRPPMLEKDMCDSWKSIMELYMLNKQHERMIIESVENGPFLWPTVEENGVTRPNKYSELSATEAIQADCDVKATNIILQGLPSEVYALVSTHKVAKELWERIQMLMQGTSLTKQERELNTKFLNILPPEWTKFVTDVKLNTLAKYMILSAADNHPPMLDKDLYDFLKSRMELYMQNIEHGRMILESVENGPLIWPTVEENRVTRTKKYVELSAAEKIQADCNMKATNIII
nr:hypothetical protein [Tanacetum cinerariifolium]